MDDLQKALETTQVIIRRCNQISENMETELRLAGFVKPEFLKIMLETIGRRLLKRAGEL